jgi:hypothetical protein
VPHPCGLYKGEDFRTTLPFQVVQDSTPYPQNILDRYAYAPAKDVATGGNPGRYCSYMTPSHWEVWNSLVRKSSLSRYGLCLVLITLGRVAMDSSGCAVIC